MKRSRARVKEPPLQGLLGNGAGGGEHLLGAGTDADVFGEIFPADDAGTVDEKFSGTRDVVLFRSAALVQEIVPANHFGLGIAEKRELVTLLAAEML